MKDSLFPVSGTPTPKLGSASSPASFRLRARRSLFAAAPAPSRALTRPENKPHETANPQNRRFLWAFVCVGGYLFVTSVVGPSSAARAAVPLRSRRAPVHAARRRAGAARRVPRAVPGPGADGDALAGLDVRAPRRSSRARCARTDRCGVSLAVLARQLADPALASALARAPAPRRPARAVETRAGRTPRAREAPREALGGGGRRERRDGWVVHGGWSTRRNETENRNRNRLLRARRAFSGPRGRRRRRRRRRELGRRVGERRLGAAHAVQYILTSLGVRTTPSAPRSGSRNRSRTGREGSAS